MEYRVTMMDVVLRRWELLFVAKTDRALIQFIRYGLVGIIAATVDIAILYYCTSVLGVFYLISVAIAFVAGVAINYTLSVLWIFRSSGKIKTEFVLYILIGVGGLILSELIIWQMVDKYETHLLAAKIVAVGLVMVWNFVLRKLMFTKLRRKFSDIKQPSSDN